VRSIGATLSIESAPQRGAELHITVPSQRYE
jgi:signal transduction histidine kinase